MKAPSTDPKAVHSAPRTSQVREVAGIWHHPVIAQILLPLLTVAAMPAARAGIFVAGGELGLQGTVEQQYDSNIFANNLEQEDFIAVFTPEAIFVRDAGLFRVEGHAGVRGYQFYDFTEQNSWDPFYQGTLILKREQNKLDGRVDVSFRRRSEANPDVNTRTRSDDFNVNGFMAFTPTEKISYRATGSFVESDLKDRRFSDLRTVEVGLEGRYQYSPKYQTLLGAGYRRSTSYDVPFPVWPMDSADVKVRAGVTGEILPKVTGYAVAGWVRREYRTVDRPSQSGLLFDTSLAWQRDDDTRVSLIVTRDFDTTPLDESVLQLITTLEVRRQLVQKWTVIAGISHRKSSYIGNTSTDTARKDESYLVRAGIDYQLTPRFRVEARGSYSTTDSNRRIADYDRSIFSVAVVALF